MTGALDLEIGTVGLTASWENEKGSAVVRSPVTFCVRERLLAVVAASW